MKIILLLVILNHLLHVANAPAGGGMELDAFMLGESQNSPPDPALQIHTGKLTLQIFYKAMDDKSQKWFHRLDKNIAGFGTIYNHFRHYIDFLYYPCASAEITPEGNLDCKDENDTDCIAGKTHACAVEKITDRRILFRFLLCLMDDTKNLPNFEKCATDNNIPYDPIKTCANSDEGKFICYACSTIGHDYKEIPTFVYNSTFNAEVNKETSEKHSISLEQLFCELLNYYSYKRPTFLCDLLFS